MVTEVLMLFSFEYLYFKENEESPSLLRENPDGGYPQYRSLIQQKVSIFIYLFLHFI
jgi:hypothetical protein